MSNGALPPGLDPRPRRRPRRLRCRAGLRATGRALAAVVSSSLLLPSFFVWNTYRSTNTGVHRLQGVIGPVAPSQPVFDGKDTNILLVGATDRAGMSRAEQRQLKVGSDASLATDTMMLVHIPADGSKATLISLPRDAYVAIPDTA